MERIHLDIVEAINKGDYAEAYRLYTSITDSGFRWMVCKYLQDFVGREKLVAFTGHCQDQTERKMLATRDSLKGKVIKEVFQEWDTEDVIVLFEDGTKASFYRGSITIFTA